MNFFFLHFFFAIQSNTKTSHKCKFFSKTFQTTMQFVFLLITTNNLSSLLLQISKLIRFFFSYFHAFICLHTFFDLRSDNQRSRHDSFQNFYEILTDLQFSTLLFRFEKKLFFFFISISNVEKSFFQILNYSIFLICRTFVLTNKSKI